LAPSSGTSILNVRNSETQNDYKRSSSHTISVVLANQCNFLQRNFLWPTTALGCKVFPTFRELTPSPYSGCAGGLIAPKLMSHHFYLQGVLVVCSTQTDESSDLSSGCAGGL